MRVITLIAAALLCAGSLAQGAPMPPDQAYMEIQAAVKQSFSAPRFEMRMNGWQTLNGANREDYSLALWYEKGKFIAETYLDGNLLLTVTADGKKLWRYNPIVREYTFVNQPTDIRQAFGIVASWARHETQRMIRLLAGSVRWLVNPTAERLATGGIRIKELEPNRPPADWRGVICDFYFDGNGRMDQYGITERLNVKKTVLREAAFAVVFDYPTTPYTFSFSFTPPAGSKPAADLPKGG